MVVIGLGLLVLMTQATGNRESYNQNYEWLVLVNAVVGTFQEGRAERSMASLRRLADCDRSAASLPWPICAPSEMTHMA